MVIALPTVGRLSLEKFVDTFIYLISEGPYDNFWSTQQISVTLCISEIPISVGEILYNVSKAVYFHQ